LVYFTNQKVISMTEKELLESRLKTVGQRKNRLTQKEAMLNTKLRKIRTRHLIKLGGLVTKAQLDEWNSNTLLGGLLWLKENEADELQIQSWARKGGAEFSKDKTPLI